MRGRQAGTAEANASMSHSSPVLKATMIPMTRLRPAYRKTGHGQVDLTFRELSGAPAGAKMLRCEAQKLEHKKALAVSEMLIAELFKADEYVIGVQMRNFSIPSTLKLWIDQVVRAGKTFAYGSTGPKGLLSGKKATLLIASGGVYEQGSAMASWNFVTPYLTTVFGFMGVADVNIIAAGGTQRLMTRQIDPQTFLAPSLEKVHAQASL